MLICFGETINLLNTSSPIPAISWLLVRGTAIQMIGASRDVQHRLRGRCYGADDHFVWHAWSFFSAVWEDVSWEKVWSNIAATSNSLVANCIDSNYGWLRLATVLWMVYKSQSYKISFFQYSRVFNATKLIMVLGIGIDSDVIVQPVMWGYKEPSRSLSSFLFSACRHFRYHYHRWSLHFVRCARGWILANNIGYK